MNIVVKAPRFAFAKEEDNLVLMDEVGGGVEVGCAFGIDADVESGLDIVKKD